MNIQHHTEGRENADFPIAAQGMALEDWNKSLKNEDYKDTRKALEEGQISDAQLDKGNELLAAHEEEREDPEERAKKDLDKYIDTYSLETQINKAIVQLHKDIDEALLLVDNFEKDLERGLFWGSIPFYDPIKRLGKGKEFKAIMKGIDRTFGNLPPAMQMQLHKVISKNDKLTPAGAKKIIAADTLAVGGLGLFGAGVATGGVGLLVGSIVASVASIGGSIHGELNKVASIKDGNELQAKLRSLKDQLSQKANPLAVQHFVNTLNNPEALSNAGNLAGVN